MYRKNRQEITDRCIDIVTKYDIRTQGDFIKKYLQLHEENISQTTVHRMFANANICIDSESGLYKYHGKPYTSEPTEEEIFRRLLKEYSYGKYTHEKGISTIWLDVDFGMENFIARKIYDFCDGNVSIICGYGCLMMRCRTVSQYERLSKVLKECHK